MPLFIYVIEHSHSQVVHAFTVVYAALELTVALQYSDWWHKQGSKLLRAI